MSHDKEFVRWLVESSEDGTWRLKARLPYESTARIQYEQLDPPKRMFKITYELKESETDDVQ